MNGGLRGTVPQRVIQALTGLEEKYRGRKEFVWNTKFLMSVQCVVRECMAILIAITSTPWALATSAATVKVTASSSGPEHVLKRLSTIRQALTGLEDDQGLSKSPIEVLAERGKPIMAEFVKDSELTLLKAPFKRCISSARYKAERVKSKNPELGELIDKVLLDLAKVDIDWKPVGEQLHAKIAKDGDED